MRVEVIFHVGLHKTGTTSFQAALTKARDTLLSGGILYPAPPISGDFTAQHADVPLMLKQGRLSEVRAYFDGVLEQARVPSNPKIETILFSSEDFSSLYFDKPAFSALADIAHEKFQLFNALLVLRNIVDLTASGLRQQIDGGSLSPRQAIAQDEVLTAFLVTIGKVRFLATHFDAVKALDYEDARASGDLNNYFAKALFGSHGPNLENFRLNVGQERDEQIVGLLSAQLRALVSMVRDSHPYSSTVRDELERIIDFDRIKTCVRREHAKEFATSYDAYVRKVVSEVFVRQKPKIDGEMTSLAPLHRDMLVRGLTAGADSQNHSSGLMALEDKQLNVYEARLPMSEKLNPAVSEPFFQHAGRCPACGAETTFVAEGPYFRNTLKCTKCKSAPRHRALMHVLSQYFPNWHSLRVHESSPGWDIVSQRLARECSNYTASQYDLNTPSGELVEVPRMPCRKYRCENLEAQTFQDQSFDLVITQDVFEHIFHPDLAIREIARTLKPGGAALMTVPIVRKNKPSRRRAALVGGRIVNLVEPPQFHGNPINREGALVTIDWGFDVVGYLQHHSGLSFLLVQIDNIDLGIRADLIEVLVGFKAPIPSL